MSNEIYPTFLPKLWNKIIHDLPEQTQHILTFDDSQKISAAMLEFSEGKIEIDPFTIVNNTVVEATKILSGCKNIKTLSFLIASLWPERFGLIVNEKNN